MGGVLFYQLEVGGDALGQLWGAAERLAGQVGEQVAKSVAEVAGEGAELVNSVARTDWARELGEFGQGLQGEASLVADAVKEDPMARCGAAPAPRPRLPPLPSRCRRLPPPRLEGRGRRHPHPLAAPGAARLSFPWEPDLPTADPRGPPGRARPAGRPCGASGSS